MAGVALGFEPEGGADGVGMAKHVRAEVGTMRTSLPHGVAIEFARDHAVYIEALVSRVVVDMLLATARALADLAREPVPDAVKALYKGETLEFGPGYIIPKPFDRRVLSRVSPAVAQAAIDTGVAQEPLDMAAYKAKLEGWNLGV